MQDQTDRPPHVSVFVVDDDPAILDTLMEILSTNDFTVAGASSVEVAMDMLSTGFRPDVILLDLMMPHMDGRHLLATLKADKLFSTIPVVMMTASPISEVKGAECVLHKPFSLNVLFARLRENFVTKPEHL